jgi:hypothetical protein
MTYELHKGSDDLKIKTLEEINNDITRGDFINLIMLSSDLVTVIVKNFLNLDAKIRELASRAMVITSTKNKI